MKKIRLILPLLVTLLISLSALASAAPLRLAQYPVIDRAWCSADVLMTLNSQVSRATHVPLNGYLKTVEYLPEEELFSAMRAVRQEMGAKAKDKELLRPLAARLKADMVVLPILDGYQEWQRMSWHRGTIYHSYASVMLYVYDARTDEVVKKGASRFYDDESSAMGTAFNMAKEAMDDVLRSSHLHERIYPSKK
ncbi:MAG: hypothetical protein IJU00_00025 [Selenomonas sp.]|nr:hypothetical protein [Selenomonas sp.]